jgi:SAM-dependent methyltransferase
MDLATFAELLAPAGQAALAAAGTLPTGDEHFLANLARLQKQHPAALAKAALETATLRARATGKFSRAAAMYFTRDGLEQSSGEAIASYRARRFAAAGTALDLGCGLGADSLALAAHCQVTGFDLDPLRLAMAAENVAAYGRGARARFVAGDFTQADLPPAGAFFFDPARRENGRRKFSVRQYLPPLASVQAWLPAIPAGAAKISPGVDLDELAGYDAEIEFISERGELKECALWFGAFKTAGRRATLLSAAAVHTLLADPAAGPIAPPGPPLAYLYEPDPAVLRAGLVTTLAAHLGARQMDADIAYLTAADRRETPFARAFAIEAALPFQLKRLRAALRERQVGVITVKKRGSPLEPEALIQQLRLSGPEERIVFLTHVLGEPWALIGTSA